MGIATPERLRLDLWRVPMASNLAVPEDGHTPLYLTGRWE